MSGWKDIFDDAKWIEIKQKFDMLEAFSGFERENRQVITIKGEEKAKKKWQAKEKSDCCSRNLCNPRQRAFDIKIEDEDEDCVMKLKKEFALNCLDACCLPELKMIDYENDKELGQIRMNCTLCSQIDVTVYDDGDDPRFRIKSDCCPLPIICRGTLCGLACQEMEIPIYTDDMSKKVATIYKKTRGCGAAFSDADSFKCKFEDELTTKEKALLLGACFMIDFGYFEDSPNNNESLI